VISGIVLAAGTASRFGRTKQLLEHDGRPLAQHAIDAATGAKLDEIVLVLGHEAESVQAAVALPPNARAVRNARYREGQSTSLAAGLAALDPASEGAVVLQGDQPGVTASMIDALVGAYRRSHARIVRLRFRDGPGPALLGRDVWQEVGRIQGDAGARELMEAHPEWVEEVVLDTEAPIDVDTPEDYERLARSG
jgi:molybdenum cofactor cytidylyltransferase